MVAERRVRVRKPDIMAGLWHHCRRAVPAHCQEESGSAVKVVLAQLRCMVVLTSSVKVASNVLLWIGGPVMVVGTLSLGLHWALGLAVGVALTFALADLR